LYMPYIFFPLIMSALDFTGTTSLQTKLKRYVHNVLQPNLGSSITQHHH
jgi:hypothetical protein